MSDTILKNITFKQSKLQYSYFDRTKIYEVQFENIDFTEASMTEAKIKRFATTESRFVKNNFYKTMLTGVDFTNNEFIAPIVSTPPLELKGVIIDLFQAADLIGMWGVVVKRG